MEHLEQRFQTHDRRISDTERKIHEMEKREMRRDNEMELFKMSLATVDAKVTDVKENLKAIATTVKEDGEKTRSAQDAQTTNMMSVVTRLVDRMDNVDGLKETAATREHETQRTKMQVVKDVSIAVLALVGSIVGATVAYQELIAGLFK